MADETKTVYITSGIFYYSIKQAIAWLMKEFELVSGRNLATKIVGNRTNLRQAFAGLAAQNQEGEVAVQYPFCLAVIADISTDTDKGGFKKNHSTNGIMVGKDIEKGIAYFEDLRPVKVGLGLNFRTDNIQDVIALAHALLMKVPRVTLTAKGANGFRIETGLQLDPSITIPETNSDTAGDSYSYDFVMALSTYIGYASDMRLIRNIRINETVQGDDFFEGDPFYQLTKTINFQEYLDTSSPLYRGPPQN